MKKLTQEDYHAYMLVLNKVIRDTKSRIKSLPKQEKMSELSYEEWLKVQKRSENKYK